MRKFLVLLFAACAACTGLDPAETTPDAGVAEGAQEATHPCAHCHYVCTLTANGQECAKVCTVECYTGPRGTL